MGENLQGTFSSSKFKTLSPDRSSSDSTRLVTRAESPPPHCNIRQLALKAALSGIFDVIPSHRETNLSSGGTFSIHSLVHPFILKDNTRTEEASAQKVTVYPL